MFRAAALFKRWHGFLVSAAVFALVVLRQFEPGLVLTRSILGNWRVWVLFLVLAYLLGKLFASAATRPKTSSTTRPRGHAREEAELDFTLLIFAATNLIIQLAGEYGAYLFPFNYLLMALIVIYLGTPTAVAFSFFIPALDALGRFFAGASFVTVGTMLGLHTAMGLVFVGVVGYFLWSERTERARAVDKLDRLTGDAMALAGDPADSAPAVLRDRKDARDVRHTRELDEELADLVEMARDALKAEACVALFATRDRGVLRVRAMAGPSDELDEDAVIPIDGSLPGLVFRQEAPLVLNRVERRGPQLDYRRKRKGVRSLAAHPIMSGPESVGVLVADSVNEDHFDEAAREYLARVARRIEKEYSDARRVTDIDREREEFAAYYDMVKRFAETREVSEVLETAFEAGRQIVAFDAALISFAEEGDKGLVAAVADLPEKWIGLEFDTGDSLSGWVTQTKQYLAYKRADEAMHRLYHPDCRFRGFESLLILPLRFHDTVLGTLAFFWKRPDAFSSYDVKLLEAVAIHAATSLDSARMYERMERLATTDGLTGLPNHRTFQLRMDEEVARERRLRTPLSLVLLDIDHFKNINDTYGHPVGDLVLKRVAAMLADAIRDVDMAARYGGEEFALILTNAKPEGAAKFAERLRKSIAREAIPYPGGSLNITVSLGVATMPNDARDKQDLVEAADKALYFSKEHGRNRVTWAGEIRSESAAGADDFTSAPVN